MTIDRVASASSRESRFVAALVGDGSGGLGVVTVAWEDLVSTQAEIGCGKSPDCRSAMRGDGSGLVIIERPGYGSVEKYRADGYQVRWVTADRRVDAVGARFWDGGPSLSAAPLSITELTALADDVTLAS